ncbi:hypothetical protein D3C81_1285650 [compost metagenome]
MYGITPARLPPSVVLRAVIWYTRLPLAASLKKMRRLENVTGTSRTTVCGGQ